MSVLGIDQSFTSTGFCVLSDDGTILTRGVITTEPNKQKKIEITLNRAKDIAEKLAIIADMHEVNKVCIEGLSFCSKGDATRDLGILFGYINAKLVQPITIVPPTTLKKYATGKGNSKKEGMFNSLPEYAQQDISQILKTKGRYDVTDAFWLAHYGINN